MVEERIKKKFDWQRLMDKCSKCKSTDLERTEVFRYTVIETWVDDLPKYKEKKQWKYRCNSCKEEFYK